MKSIHGPIAVLLALAFVAPATAQPSRPADYSDFVVPAEVYRAACSGDALDLQAAIDAGDNIYIPRRTDESRQAYLIDNPIEIDIPGTLYIHGADKFAVMLRSCTPSLPMFEIAGAGLVQISGMFLEPTHRQAQRPLELAGTTTDWPLIHVNPTLADPDNPPTTPAPLELVDVRIDRGTVRIESAGEHRMQNVGFTAEGVANNSLEVNHEDADLLIVGGNFTSSRFCEIGGLSCAEDNPCASGSCYPATADAIDNYHVRQFDGRLRIYSVGVQAAIGQADFRIDKANDADPSVNEPHVIANVRSEGVKLTTNRPSELLHVPASSEAVDVVVMNNAASWHAHSNKAQFWGAGHLVDYSAAGNLWLIGNSSSSGAGQLVEGNPAASASITAIGNRWLGNHTLDDATGATSLFDFSSPEPVVTGNLFDRARFCGSFERCAEDDQICDESLGVSCTCQNIGPMNDHPVPPCLNCTGPGQLTCLPLSSHFDGLPTPDVDDIFGGIPDFGDLSLPLPLTRPLVTSPLPGMIWSFDCEFTGAGNPCTDYYPDSCSPVCGKYNDYCTAQGTLNAAMATRSPALFNARHYHVEEPLQWANDAQIATLTDFPTPNQAPGGWIVGLNNNTTLKPTVGSYCVYTGESCVDTGDCTFGGCPDSCVPRPTPPSVFETSIAYGIVQGIHFDAPDAVAGTCTSSGASCYIDEDCGGTPDDCVINYNPTVKIENDNPVNSFLREQQQSSFLDCDFEGGRHALGMCVESSIQCDTNMFVNASFDDAYVGYNAGGENALHNTLWNVSFDNNVIAMGHDEDFEVQTPPVAQSGTWSVLHGTTTNTSGKDVSFLGGADRSVYLYEYETDSDAIFDEQGATNSGISILFHESRLLGDAPSVVSPQCTVLGPFFAADYHSNGLAFLDTYVEAGGVCLMGGVGSRYALKLRSVIPDWGQSEFGASSEGIEWLEECIDDIPCPSHCNPNQNQCDTFQEECVRSDASNDIEVCTERVVCRCKGGQGCSSADETTISSCD